MYKGITSTNLLHPWVSKLSISLGISSLQIGLHVYYRNLEQKSNRTKIWSHNDFIYKRWIYQLCHACFLCKQWCCNHRKAPFRIFFYFPMSCLLSSEDIIGDVCVNWHTLIWNCILSRKPKYIPQHLRAAIIFSDYPPKKGKVAFIHFPWNESLRCSKCETSNYFIIKIPWIQYRECFRPYGRLSHQDDMLDVLVGSL